MNLIEAYLKYFGQFILLISGLSGVGKTYLAKEIARDFKIKYINLNDYCKKDYDEVVKLSNGVSVTNWDNADAYDWKKFNEDVETAKGEGIVISGMAFPTDNLEFTPDFHIHLKMAKQELLKKRHEYLDKNENNPKCATLLELKDTDTEALILNKMTMPLYYKYLEKSKVDLFINATEKTGDQIYDDVFSYLTRKMKYKLDSRPK
jgi:broad-specificity NMP kinase